MSAADTAAAAPPPEAQLGAMVFAVLLLDRGDVIRQANPASEDMLGSSAARLIGCPFGQAVRIPDRRVGESFADQDTRLIARGIAIETAAGERAVNLTSSPMPAFPGWRVVTLSDVGQAALDIAEAPVPISAPSVLAHEIKNPLCAIRGASQLLERRSDERSRPLARMISQEVDRIAALIDRMQQLGSRSAPVIESCNLHEVVRNALGVVAAAQGGGVRFVEEFDPSLPAVDVDRVSLEQILINLLSNACDASDSLVEAEIIIRTRYVGGLVFSAMRLGRTVRLPIELSVIDRGPGVPSELREHIFEPFVTGRKNGQGLGLALVQKLVRDMGGRIGHHRDDATGTTQFRLNLPISIAGGDA